MTKEQEWTQAPEDFLPEDVEIVEAGIEYWDRNLAEQYGFSDLVPGTGSEVSYYVAVGINADGEIVGAMLLSEEPIDQNQEHWVRERHELFLTNKALKIFDLIPPENMV